MSHQKPPAICLPEISELAELVGDFMQYWGFKHIHGRIWTHLYLSSTPMDAGTLIKKLKVSKALVSMSIKELLEHEVIQEVGKAEYGTVLFQANPDVIQVILGVIRKREKQMISRVSAAHKLLVKLQDGEKTECRICPDRLQSLGKMIEHAESAIDSILALGEIDLNEWKKI